MHIDILMFEDCPNASVAYERVMKALEAEGIIANVDQIDVPTMEAAQELRFLGSPSVRINGDDVEPNADRRQSYGLMCRTYLNEGQTEGAPSIEVIRAAMRAAQR